MHRLRIALCAALIWPPSAPASAAKPTQPPLTVGAQFAAFSSGPSFDGKNTQVAPKDLALLESSGYRIEENGQLFEPGSKNPVPDTDYYYILEELRSGARLKALLELNLVLNRSDYGRRTSAEDRKEMRRIGLESWWLLSKRTRKQIEKHFSETEIWKLDRSLVLSPAAPPYAGTPISLSKLPDGVPFPEGTPLNTLTGSMMAMNLSAAPRNLNPDTFSPIPDAENPLPLRENRIRPQREKTKKKPVIARRQLHPSPPPGPKMAMLPLSPMRAVVPAASHAPGIPMARRGSMKPKTLGFVSLPEAPSDAESFKNPPPAPEEIITARAAAAMLPLLAAPMASAAALPRGNARSAAPAAVPVRTAPPLPARNVDAPPPLPSDEEMLFKKPRVGPDQKSPAPMPTAPTAAALPAAMPAPPVPAEAAKPAPQPQTRRPRTVKFDARKFGKFLASAPYGKAEKSLLGFLANHTREPERSQALGFVTSFMPHIVIDSRKAGAHAHYSISQVADLGRIQIALHDGPVLVETGALFKKDKMHFLPDSAEYYAGIGVSPPPLTALSRETPPKKEDEQRPGRVALYKDGSMRLRRGGEQLAGALLRSLMMLDGAIRGWTDDPFHTELRAITAEFRFYRTLHKETGKEPVLDREARALYQEWLDRPEDFLDIMVQNIAGRRPRHGISVLERSGALPKGAAPRPLETGEPQLLIPTPASEALEAWLEAERRIRGDP